MTSRKFVHTLSFPEHIWINFFRNFFNQDVLMVDDDLQPVRNNFKYEDGQDPSNRAFDILFEHDMDTANPNILPSLVIEDLGMQSLNISIDRLADWSVGVQTSKTRSDLLRSTYILHCCARKRGESRIMASMVSNAITVFYDVLKRDGLHKVEPWSIGKTVPIKSDSDETYVDTPVQVSFETQQTWKTVEDGTGFAKRFCLVIQDDSLVRYVRLSLDVTDPSVSRYLAMSMDVQDPNMSIFINTSLNAVDQPSLNSFVNTSLAAVDPVAFEGYVRTSMRVT